MLQHLLPLNLPHILGTDVSGTVVALGPAGTEPPAIRVGDPVIGRTDTGGAAAEYITAAAGSLVVAPTSVPLSHAAAIPVAGLTAWQAVFEHARVEPGRRVLVSGAGGGVGRFAVQLAKHAGAHVIATASPRSSQAVRALGADQIVDYSTTPVTAAVRQPIDVLLHLVPGPAPALSLLRPGGVAVSATGPIEPPSAEVPAMHFVARNDSHQLTAPVELIDLGAIRVDIAAERPLTDLASVHRDAESGRLHGKTIIVL